MHDAEKLSLEQIEAFLKASQEIRFEGEHREQVYGWVEQVLRQQHYQKHSRKARGLVRSYLEKMTGVPGPGDAAGRSLSGQRRDPARPLSTAPLSTTLYPRRYRYAGHVDAAHESLSGPATRRILQREYQDYGKPEFSSGWPPSRWPTCTTCATTNAIANGRLHYSKTRPTAVTIGKRRRPDPQGQPGGTRVHSTREMGRFSIFRTENKRRVNKRLYLRLER